jgi:hypothetical protein
MKTQSSSENDADNNQSNKYPARVWIHEKPHPNLVRLRRPDCVADHMLPLLISRMPLDEFTVQALIQVVANIFGAFGKRGHAFRATATFCARLNRQIVTRGHGANNRMARSRRPTDDLRRGH